mgnify:CR=1 FL=1
MSDVLKPNCASTTFLFSKTNSKPIFVCLRRRSISEHIACKLRAMALTWYVPLTRLTHSSMQNFQTTSILVIPFPGLIFFTFCSPSRLSNLTAFSRVSFSLRSTIIYFILFTQNIKISVAVIDRDILSVFIHRPLVIWYSNLLLLVSNQFVESLSRYTL